jgi:predicted secreted hydrolase
MIRRAALILAGSLLFAQEPDLSSRILELHTPGHAPAERAQAPTAPGVPGAPPLDLPRDEGQHPDAAFERWVLRGSLQGPLSERRYALQVVFARRGVPSAWAGSHAWRSDRWWVSQVSLLPPGGRKVLFEERSGREGLPASASQAELDLKVEGWSLGPDASGKLKLRVRLEEGAVELEFSGQIPPVSLPPVEGRPVHRALQPLLQAQGQLSLKGQIPAQVSGRFSLLHEWGATPPPHWLGWDQLVLHFNDRRTWILDGGRSAEGKLGSSCQLLEVDARGRVTRMVKNPPVTFRKSWTSPISSARYPISLQIDAWKEQIGIDPSLENQEARPSRPGAATVYRGAGVLQDGRGDAVGDAFLDLAGYAHPLRTPF